jgi:hypothetical protein
LALPSASPKATWRNQYIRATRTERSENTAGFFEKPIAYRQSGDLP